MLMIMLIYTKDDELYVEELYLELKDDMLYIANKILHNQDDAEDAVHAAFINIIKHLQRIQGLQKNNEDSGRKNAAYCIVIVKNTSRRMFNKRKAQETTPIENVDYDLASDDDPAEHALHNNLLESLDEIVKTMPEYLARPFVLRYYKEMKYADIGKLLDISPNAAQKRVERATDIILQNTGKEAFI